MSKWWMPRKCVKFQIHGKAKENYVNIWENDDYISIKFGSTLDSWRRLRCLSSCSTLNSYFVAASPILLDSPFSTVVSAIFVGRIFCTGKHRSSPAFLVSELLYFCPDRWDIIMGIYFIGDSTSEPNHIVLMGVPVVPRKAVAEVSKIGNL